MASWAGSPDPKPQKRHRASGAQEKAIRRAFKDAVCLYSGRRPAERHHIIPRSQGGDDVIANLAPLCRSCHARLEDHGPGWEGIAAAVRKYVLTNRDRCTYAIGKVGWERFNNRYPLLSGPENPSAGETGLLAASGPESNDAVEGHSR